MAAKPHLRIVRTVGEEAYVAPSSTEKRAAGASQATWKFDLFDTVSADPMCDGSCLLVVVAYSRFCRTTQRVAYLSEIDLQVATGLQPRAIRKAKEALVRLGYMAAVSKTASGITVYRLANPRKDLVTDHKMIASETMKEVDAVRRDEERRRRRLRGSKSAPLNKDEGGADLHPTEGADLHPNSVDTTVEKILHDNRGSTGSGLGAYVRETWTMPDGWPPLPREW